MATNENYFPWSVCQLWLREGIRAGEILNKVIVATWPQQPPKEQWPYELKSTPEEIKLLEDIIGKTSDARQKEAVQHLLDELKSKGGAYPNLYKEVDKDKKDNEIAKLWLALVNYGTNHDRYKDLHTKLKSYLTGFGSDTDKAIRSGMDNFWRSLGPAMNPNRSDIEKSPH